MVLQRIPLLAIAFLGTAAAAAQGASDVARSGAPPGALTPRAAAAPLKGELRVSPGGLRLVAMQTSIDALAKGFNQLSGYAKAYEFMAKSIPEMVKQCSAKAYSVQDQAAAGCSAGDTVAQCSDKLLKHCLASFKGTSLPGGIGLPIGSLGGAPYGSTGGSTTGSLRVGFSIQDFQKAANAVAAEARALSQALSVYAGQVEQNAKSLLP